MRNWGFSPSPDELVVVAKAAKLYRDHWASIRPPFIATFDGSMADVRALDYLDYEGINVPGAGIESAAMVCGEVLCRTLGLEWVISYRGDWFVASEEESWPEIALCPLARLHEFECNGRGKPSIYSQLIWEAAFDCALSLDEEKWPKVCAIFEDDGAYLEFIERTLGRFRHPRRYQ